MNSALKILLISGFVILWLFSVTCSHKERSFTIDYVNDTFLKDGEPFQYISGSIHYSRLPSMYWEDRLAKMRAAGLNAIQTYVMWNFHQTSSSDTYNFADDRDLEKFLSLAAKYDLLVILRAGPYVCGEWDFGGLPAWLLQKNASMIIRSSDRQYFSYVSKWMSVLLPKIRRHLYSEGGNVIMVQLENEYGSYFTCDKKYMTDLYDLGRDYLGDDVVLFTTDGFSLGYLKCGGLLDHRFYPTVDFGVGSTTDLNATFSDLRKVLKHGPLVNSEYYTGWLDNWGGSHAHVDGKAIASGLRKMFQFGVNVNMYMFFGGTNFGFWNGANSPPFSPQPTSYDYAAPIQENGDTSWNYYLIRDTITNFTRVKPPSVPANVSVTKYPNVSMIPYLHVLQAAEHITVRKLVNLQRTVTMESLGQFDGFALYDTHVALNVSSAKLTIPLLRDFGLVFWEDTNSPTAPHYSGYFSWTNKSKSLSMNFDVKLPATVKLRILVENSGHVNYGPNMFNNSKGILSDVYFNSVALYGWNVSTLNISRISRFPLDDRISHYEMLTRIIEASKYPSQGMFYSGSLSFSPGGASDAFVKFPSWCKGQFLINDINVGRYWPCVGPQVTLYVPRAFWKNSTHAQLILLELQDSSCGRGSKCQIEFSSSPELNGKQKPTLSQF